MISHEPLRLQINLVVYEVITDEYGSEQPISEELTGFQFSLTNSPFHPLAVEVSFLY